MSWPIYVGIAAFVLLLLAVTRPGKRRKRVRSGWQRREFLFSPEDRLFFTALKAAVGQDYEIFARIPVADVLSPRAPGRGRARETGFESLAARRFGFLLCRTEDLAVACAVELRAAAAGEPEDPLVAACHGVGLPLARFDAAPFYSPAEIREAIAAAVRKEPLHIAETDRRREPSLSGLKNLEL